MYPPPVVVSQATSGTQAFLASPVAASALRLSLAQNAPLEPLHDVGPVWHSAPGREAACRTVLLTAQRSVYPVHHVNPLASVLIGEFSGRSPLPWSGFSVLYFRPLGLLQVHVGALSWAPPQAQA